MGFQRGKPRPQNSGRKKGTPNKDTLTIQQLCEQHGVNPIEVLIEFCKPITESGLRPQDILARITRRFDAAKELAQYLYPKRKALEIDATVNADLAKKAEEIEKLPIDVQKQMLKDELKRLEGE